MLSASARTDEVPRPALRWHGGKWLLAPWIVGHFPDHRVYTECFGGAASVLIRKGRSYSEIYNDLDSEVVTFFEIVRDPATAAQLADLLRLTPYARAEFERAYYPTNNPMELARRLVVRSYMGFGSDGHNTAVKTGFRANANRSGTTPSHDWANYPDAIPALCERLQGVVIECRPAIRVMEDQDSPETLHYVDPPYLPDTRSQKSRRGKIRYHAYKHEMTNDDHKTLLGALRELQGMVVLSGYPSPLYDRLLRGWTAIERGAKADGARDRTEVLWLNPPAAERQPQPSFL